MTKDERSAQRVARKFLAAVKALEAFTADPDMVYDELRIVAYREPAKIKATMADVLTALRGEEDL